MNITVSFETERELRRRRDAATRTRRRAESSQKPAVPQHNRRLTQSRTTLDRLGIPTKTRSRSDAAETALAVTLPQKLKSEIGEHFKDSSLSTKVLHAQRNHAGDVIALVAVNKNAPHDHGAEAQKISSLLVVRLRQTSSPMHEPTDHAAIMGVISSHEVETLSADSLRLMVDRSGTYFGLTSCTSGSQKIHLYKINENGGTTPIAQVVPKTASRALSEGRLSLSVKQLEGQGIIACIHAHSTTPRVANTLLTQRIG